MNLFLLVHVSCLLILTDCYKSSEGDDHGALFIFGDSMFDAGNNNYINTIPQDQANYWPYGESYFHPPSGRFSDGRIIPDFIAEFAKLPLIPAYLDPRNNDFSYGANFASAGAGVLNTTDPTTTICLKRQLDNFFDVVKNYRTKLGDAKAEQLLSDAVYLFSFGSNDYQRVPKNETSFYIEQWVQLVVGDLMDVFKAIHEKGGRKIGITSLTTLGCLPAFRFQESGHVCNEQLNMIASLHDSEISKKLEELSQQLEGFMYAKYELQVEITKRMKNPTKYGFKVGVTACCGYGAFRGIDSCGGKRLFKKFELCDNPSNFILFDCHHPTEATNRQLAKLLWSGDSQVTSPYNLKALFQAAKYKKGGIATIESTNTKSGGEATHVNM